MSAARAEQRKVPKGRCAVSTSVRSTRSGAALSRGSGEKSARVREARTVSLAVRVPLRDRVVAESELRVVPRVTALEAPHVPQLAFDVHLLVRGVHILAAVLALCVRTTPQLLPRLLHLFRLRRGGINRRCTTHAWKCCCTLRLDSRQSNAKCPRPHVATAG